MSNKKKHDLTDLKYGELTAIRSLDDTMSRNTEWVCICSCGKEVVKKASFLINGNVKSCGHLKGQCKRSINKYIEKENYTELHIINRYKELFVAKIDSKHVEICKKYCWSTNGKYVVCRSNDIFISLHRMICGLNADITNLFVDHINGDTLDNREENLRPCVHQENCRNARNSKYKSKCGVIGVRQDIRCINSWRAQIYIDKNKKIEKTYKDKELAIIQRLVWEVEYFKEFAPQIELIKSNYPYLLNIEKTHNMKFSDDIELIKSIGESLKEDPHCPCMLAKNENTICPCLPCRTKQHCHCGIFVPKDTDLEEIKDI